MENSAKSSVDPNTNFEECSASAAHDAHDITSLSDLPGKRMRTKLWPMSPIESLTQEEVMAIANRDHTPVLIAVMNGDETGEKYICSNKKGASLPPEIAAEGSWAKKYYQQVVSLTESIKEMQDTFQPVWELAKSQQALLVSVEIFDGILAVANQGLQLLFKTWSYNDLKAIITEECDFRGQKQVNYYGILKNYTMGRFASLDQSRLKTVEDLLFAGETYLIHHAHTNGFDCPSDIRSLFQEFLPLKQDRNEYSHPLTLAKGQLASTVLQKLRASVLNDEFDFIKGTKNLILLGADYAESVFHSYGKVRQKLFLDPKRRSKKRHFSYNSDDDSPYETFPQSPRGQTPTSSSQSPSFGKDFQVGQSSQSPRYSPSSRSPSLGSPLTLSYPHIPEILQKSHALKDDLEETSNTQTCQLDNRNSQLPNFEGPLTSPSLENIPSTDNPSSPSESTESHNSQTLSHPTDRRFKRPRR